MPRAHVFVEAHFFRSLEFGIKGIKLGHLEEGEFDERSSRGALGGKEKDPLGGNTQRQIFLGGNQFWSLRRRRRRFEEKK